MNKKDFIPYFVKMSSANKKECILGLRALGPHTLEFHVQSLHGFHSIWQLKDESQEFEPFDTPVWIRYKEWETWMDKTKASSQLTWSFGPSSVSIRELYALKDGTVRKDETTEFPFVSAQNTFPLTSSLAFSADISNISTLECPVALKTIPQLQGVTFCTYENHTWALSTIGGCMQGIMLESFYHSNDEYILDFTYLKNLDALSEVQIFLDEKKKVLMIEEEKNHHILWFPVNKGKGRVYGKILSRLHTLLCTRPAQPLQFSFCQNELEKKNFEKKCGQFRKQYAEDVTDRFETQVCLENDRIGFKTNAKEEWMKEDIAEEMETNILLSYYDFFMYVDGSRGNDRVMFGENDWMIASDNRFMYNLKNQSN